MPFNYQTLKNISQAALVNNAIIGADLTTNAVTNAKLANSTITSSELGTGSVDVTQASVSGTLPVNKGGTALTSLPGSFRVLAANSGNNALEFAPTGIYRMVVFSGNGTWNRPSGVRYIKVQVQGGGGGGGGHGESGAAGGYAERVLDVTGIPSVGITIGGGGGGIL